jgi:hypothetical protein
MFTQFKFSPAQISEAAATTAKALAAAVPGSNAATFAATTIAERLRAKPASYLQYGPYWWAVKQALRALGEDFGPTDDADLRAEYGGNFPSYGALVAGEQFRTYYGKTYLAGADRFDLDADGEDSYVLFDADMEVRKLGGKHPLRVAADMAAIEVQGEQVLDDASGQGHGWVTPRTDGGKAKCGGPHGSLGCPVCRDELRAAGGTVLDATMTPFAVKFEHEAALWTANVYAADVAGAEAKVAGWQEHGRIGTAIEHCKAAGDATLDSTDYTAPLFVDNAARTLSEMAPTGALALPQ